MSGDSPDVGDRVEAAEAIVSRALAAFDAEEWDVLVALTDADSLAKLRSKYLERKTREIARKQRKEWEPPVTENAALQALFDLTAHVPVTYHELVGVSSLAEAEALSTTEFMVRWAQARHDDYLKAHGVPEGIVPAKGRVVVGSVALLPDMVAVLVRSVNVHSSGPLTGIGLVAVLGDGRGEWRLYAEIAWLDLADSIAR